MAKDPAFLFYSKDFYEGTRMMLPEERACYIDLLIYQHQNGIIPKDLKRVLMYCNGINEATLEATLEAKFKQTKNGWLNDKLEKVKKEREDFSNKQSVNGTVGQFWKKAKGILDIKDYIKLRELLNNQSNNEIFEQIKDKNIDKAMLIAMLKHLAIVNVNAIVNKEKEKGGDFQKIEEEQSYQLTEIDIYRSEREEVFRNLDESLKEALKVNIGIERPYIWVNKRQPNDYFDLVDCIVRIREDVEWRSTFQRNNNVSKEKLLSGLYEFVKKIISSKEYLGLDGYDSADGQNNFIKYFSNWFVKQGK